MHLHLQTDLQSGCRYTRPGITWLLRKYQPAEYLEGSGRINLYIVVCVPVYILVYVYIYVYILVCIGSMVWEIKMPASVTWCCTSID